MSGSPSAGGAAALVPRSLSVALLLLLLSTTAAHSAPPPPRPYSGCGVLALQAPPGAEPAGIPLYREPGLARLGEMEGSALPRLAGSEGASLVAVGARKARWSRVAYDDAGREAWIEQARGWEYLPWREFLPGRSVRILPGMKKELYAVRSDPRRDAAQQAVLTRDQTVRVLQVEDDWARLQAPAGWFRWRDADGRLAVLPQDGSGAQIR